MKKSYKIGAGIIILLLAASSLLFISASNDDFKLVKNLEIYYSLFRELNLFYVDETDPQKLVESSIEGMLENLDPYTTFIPESDQDNFKFMTTGEYGGIGALIRRSGDYSIIAEPYEGFPAAVGGLQAGDTLIAIDGKSTKGEDISSISERLKGKPGTEVIITLRRFGVENTLNKQLVRKKITIKNVPYSGMINERTGYIRLSNFTTGAAVELKEALLSLKKENTLESLVLDLRGNPGGLLIEAVDVANIFISKGQEIVSTRGKVKQWDQVYNTRFAAVDTLIPLVVLVSQGSASASEIVAGSLQDLDRAVIIGQRTFGKGLVQTTRELSYNTKLKVTTAKYYIPSGRCIQALDYTHRNEDGSVGMIPDSLISEYTTKNGRKVYDGGGILPDITENSENYSQVTTSLFVQSIIFDYATVFASKRDTIPDVTDFQITDEMFQHFKDYVSGREFSYQTQSESSLKKLIETAKKEKYYDLASGEFDALAAKLAHNNGQDLDNFQVEIKQLIKEEISTRYYFQKGRIKASIGDDPELVKAVKVLDDIESYLTILAEKTSGIHARN